jgi:hypothetical protein
MQMGELVFMLLESEGATLDVATLDFNYIEDAPDCAQQGLVGISIMPCLLETNKHTDPISHDKERSHIEKL